MADLNVQPKKTTNSWLWILLALIAIGLIYFLSKGCNHTANEAATGSHDTIRSATTSTTTPQNNGWGNINFNLPNANYSEITDKDITVRGNDQYSIYGLGNNILFDVDKSTITSNGEAKLKQIAASLNQRYKDGDVRIYGHTDSTGDAAHNQQLSEQRANAVKDWLEKNANLTDDHVSVNGLGESQPVATNATESGREQNRSVQIVARKH